MNISESLTKSWCKNSKKPNTSLRFHNTSVSLIASHEVVPLARSDRSFNMKVISFMLTPFCRILCLIRVKRRRETCTGSENKKVSAREKCHHGTAEDVGILVIEYSEGLFAKMCG